MWRGRFNANNYCSLHPFQHQAKKLESLSKELDDTKSKYIATTSEAADVKHRLDVANQKCVFTPPFHLTTTLCF